MNVNLTPELEKLIRTKVKTGRYDSASEAVRESLRLLADHDKARDAQLAEFRQGIDRRLASLDRGESIDGGEFFAELEREEGNLRRKRKMKSGNPSALLMGRRKTFVKSGDTSPRTSYRRRSGFG